MQKVNDLNVLTLYVSDIETAKKFYKEILGFEDGGEMPPGVLFKSGKVTIYAEPGRRKKPEQSREYAEFSPSFSVDSVRECHEFLKTEGVKIVEKYQEFAPDFALFKFEDPDGNLLEISGKP
ncbi:VOC family protein [candidate division WOR-3 bacterium]|nr:VOC family protein [candidate division WOR-3 bacterium]